MIILLDKQIDVKYYTSVTSTQCENKICNKSGLTKHRIDRVDL